MVKQAQSTSNETKMETVSGSKGATQKLQSKKQPVSLNYTAEERRRMITESAYYRAEQRGFQGDLALDDWLRAEAEVDARLGGGG